MLVQSPDPREGSVNPDDGVLAAPPATAPEVEPLPSPVDLLQAGLEADEGSRGRFRRALVGAVVFHLALLFVTFPSWKPRPLPAAGPQRAVTVVRTVRFQPPKPPARQQIPPKQAKRIPVPDPTPEDPEPIEMTEQPLPELDVELAEIGADVFGIPDGPPGPVGPAPMEISGNVMPPTKIHAPQPRYTEEARRARIQGVVVLQAVIEDDGTVRKVDVLKGLNLGLTESAVETVKEWTFEPATLEGEPVPVFLNLVINFSLQ